MSEGIRSSLRYLVSEFFVIMISLVNLMLSNIRLDRGQIEIVDEAMAHVLSRKTPAERISIGFNIWISAHNMLITHLRKSHPEWDERILNKEVARRLSHGTL